MRNSEFHYKALPLESFVQIADGTGNVRIALDAIQADHEIAVNEYSAFHEYTSSMDDNTQFIFALLILESEGR